MMRRNRKTRALKLWLSKYWLKLLLFAVGISLLLPFIIRYFRNQKAKNEANKLNNEELFSSAQNNQSSPQIIKDKTERIRKNYPKITKAKMEEIKAGAQKIAYKLGTNVEDNHVIFGNSVSLFNVRAWTEDEKAVVKELKKFIGTFPILEDVYYKVMTKSRNLKTDLLNYLSEDDLNEVRKVHKAKGYRWF